MAKPSHGPLAAQYWVFGGPILASLVGRLHAFVGYINGYLGWILWTQIQTIPGDNFPQTQGYIYGLRLLAYDLMRLGYESISFIVIIQASGFVYLVDKSFHQFQCTSTGFICKQYNLFLFFFWSTNSPSISKARICLVVVGHLVLENH